MGKTATQVFLEATDGTIIPGNLLQSHEFDEPTCAGLEPSWKLIGETLDHRVIIETVNARVTNLNDWTSVKGDINNAVILTKKPAAGYPITGGEGAPNGLCLIEDTLFAGRVRHTDQGIELSIRRPIRKVYQQPLKELFIKKTTNY